MMRSLKNNKSLNVKIFYIELLRMKIKYYPN